MSEPTLTINVTIGFQEEPSGNGFTGWINEIRGVIAHGDTIDEMREELIKMLQLKFEVERDRAIFNED